MGNFTKTFTTTIPFDGDQITVTMRRLKREDALKLGPYMNYGDDGNLKMTFTDQLQFVAVGAEILKANITEFSGMTIEGQEVKKDSQEYNELFEESYFMPLISGLFTALMGASFMDNEEVGKSDAGPSGTSEDTTTTMSA